MHPVTIDHIAIWTNNLEGLRNFYVKYFSAQSNTKYRNDKKGFSSYFLSFGSNTRIEIMTRDTGIGNIHTTENTIGLAHIAFSLGSKAAVDAATEGLRKDGYVIASEPRTTGDGYYESAVLDPDGNYVEITE